MDNKFETVKFTLGMDSKKQAREIMDNVYQSLKEKGYNPISQIVGYILSGDPSYITSYNNARGIITRLERDELLEEIIKEYLSYSQE
ncbi:MAG: IreB family regulatory phosphoprotein [Clostridia bacterium]|nr:IreB family regulatory phosphoprotein [Clostridia bacterium]